MKHVVIVFLCISYASYGLRREISQGSKDVNSREMFAPLFRGHSHIGNRSMEHHLPLLQGFATFLLEVALPRGLHGHLVNPSLRPTRRGLLKRSPRSRLCSARMKETLLEPTLEREVSDVVTKRIVLITGFESFNVKLYKDVAANIARRCPGVELRVFSDRDIASERGDVEKALDGADVFFGSLLFDFDQVEWLREKIKDVPVRLVFESALELMSSTKIGSFTMSAPDGQKAGPPPVIKALLSKFGSGKEEDKLVGYLKFLKVGPKLLRFVPGEKARDLRNWLQVYAYWNQGGEGNVEEAFLYLASEYLQKTNLDLQDVKETPAIGVFHPDLEATGESFFESPAAYLQWFRKRKPHMPAAAPVVGVLLYRKHVITRQPYLGQLVQALEEEGIVPIPIFINGVEAHTVVRDMLTTVHELEERARGHIAINSLKQDAVKVDAIVNTVGFPLVGGPAGTMESGRQADVAKAILAAKNVPYVVAAPMLIQDIASWVRDGIQGLQSVVLYALPELDGAIDTVTLGGLVGDDIFLVKERCIKLARRLKKWVKLRRDPVAERKVACLLYGFPPGVGATGTAALLNVPRSIDNLLSRLSAEGYLVAEPGQNPPTGDAIVAALQAIGADGSVNSGLNEATKIVNKTLASATAGGSVVDSKQLKEWLKLPSSWGPTEWGPMPFLPAEDRLIKSVENNWGDLDKYRGIMTSADGGLVVPGVQVGNVFFGVQPALGFEGDPMRLLFERDLTPHPQYIAFYKWLQESYQADIFVHFGMHGTVEWLPGSPLGNTGLSWSDVLLGDVPNVYLYAANNPSESVVAKRRGYGTIISHNVPPYGRSGLYKQMSELRALLQEYREDPRSASNLRGPIVDALMASGLQEDCPYIPEGQVAVKRLTAENIDEVEDAAFDKYMNEVYAYLGVVENRLFSAGLHTLGEPPSRAQMESYLEAYFGDDLPREKLEDIANGGNLTTKDTLLPFGNSPEPDEHYLHEAIQIRELLSQTTEELDSMVRAMNGEYVLPAAGGDLLRDGAGVLPTGRNIHALDPYRMPSIAAVERGTAAAEAILAQHLAEFDGSYPETVSVNLWGLDAIKTKGESIAIVLALVGAKPIKEGTGRVVRYDLLPLKELGGRPRIDVLCSMSGIFRDTFANVVDLLDDLFRRAAEADEPTELNMIKKHTEAIESVGVDGATARIFSNPPGDYGSMVNERVGASNWEESSELGDTWVSRNAYSYGRGGERGAARPEVLQQLLSTTDRVVQEIDSVEYGMTDIQEYYANTGSLIRAANSAKEKAYDDQGMGGTPPAKVACSIIETFTKEVEPRSLDETLRLEYRTKLLNPRWAESMASQGRGGAYEISQRMTALIGWGATTGFSEQWVYNGAHETYVEDEEMRDRLRQENPEAFRNVVKRLLEGAGRGFWDADEAQLDMLKQLYEEADDQLEGINDS